MSDNQSTKEFTRIEVIKENQIKDDLLQPKVKIQI